MKLRLLLAAVAAPIVFLAPDSASRPLGQQGLIAPLDLAQEPVLVYDVTGGSFGGPVHSSLVVYQNGLVSWSSVANFIPGDGEACVTMVPVQAVKRLARELEDAGANSLPDELAMGADIPLSTVTFLRSPGTDSKAHTFSFFAGYDEISFILFQFQQEHVPFCGGLTK